MAEVGSIKQKTKSMRAQQEEAKKLRDGGHTGRDDMDSDEFPEDEGGLHTASARPLSPTKGKKMADGMEED